MRFIQPAISSSQHRHYILKSTATSMLLGMSGAAFGYFVVIPASLRFFAKFDTNLVHSLISASNYFSFVLNCILTFAIIFQIPVVIGSINNITPISPSSILKYQKLVIFGSFVISLVLPFTYDPLSQLVLAAPIIGLYYLSIILLSISNRKNSSNNKIQNTNLATKDERVSETGDLPLPAYKMRLPKVLDLSSFNHPIKPTLSPHVLSLSPKMPHSSGQHSE